jgi:diadenosine tetraphosphate (Ap4A) HIT family hydrolase
MAHYDQSDMIHETNYFVLTRSQRPYVDRLDGGHLRIFCKRAGVIERRDFTPQEAIDFIRLSSAAGQALEQGMKKRGIDIVKINFEELGNWPYKYGTEPIFHEHIFGRAKDAKTQIFPEAVQLPPRETGFYEGFEPLNDDDLQAVKTELEAILATPKFASQSEWRLA